MAFIEAKPETLARIKVVGVGGGGQNAVGSMITSNQVDEGVEFIVMNTDLQALNSSKSQIRVQLGPETTHGLGSGADPSVGQEAAQESADEIKNHLQGADMVFVAAGMGGGTGTGAAPVIADIAKGLGALTVGVVTKPFIFEGKRRQSQAEQGVLELRDKVDALICIPNEKLLEVVDDDVSLLDAFKIADQVIGKAVEGISELITSTGLVNVDFADVKTVMQNAGSALMGIGESDGENRAEEAARKAVNSPLLDVDIKGSTGILINVVGDSGMTMHEVNTAAKIVSEAAHEAANIIFGANIDPEMQGIRVTVIATGFDSDFRSMNIAGYNAMDDEELITQIDSRFDQKSSDDDLDDQVTEEIEPTRESSHSDSNEFDIDAMRKEVERMETENSENEMEQDENDSNDNDNEDDSQSGENDRSDSDDNGGFFKNFIKNRR